MATLGIVGTATWGTTLGIISAREGHEVRLLARTDEEAASLRLANENGRFLPGVPFPSSVAVTASAGDALSNADLVVIAVPSSTLRKNARQVRDSISGSAVVVSATKGIEIETGNRMSEVLQQELAAANHAGICALSGPNLAREIIQGKLSSTVVASPNEDASKMAQSILNSSVFRVYTNTDIVGVELGGTLKNIIAIGAGMCDGLGFGDNTKAAFMTRGLAEIARLGVAAGAKPMTLSGLAGMGDLIATCSSTLSRNHYVGAELGKGRTLEEIREGMKNVAEGVDATAAAKRMATKLGVEMPITEVIFQILFNDMSIRQAVTELMGRTPTPE